MFYSASTRGFYDQSVHATLIPADAVEVSAADHAALLSGQAQGQDIVPDEAGRPILVSRE